ncbi:MAG: Hpt domain-containing protein [Burkholderiaceae bacterium]|nr:Hpt domain-containing protein [Burkholderiaceae bacterium]
MPNAQTDPNVQYQPLDPQALSKLRELDPGGGNQLLQRVVQAYMKSLEHLLPELGRACMGQIDLSVVKHVTHTLKSSSASLGAVHLAHICSEIETMARLGQTAGIDSRLQAMHDELAHVRAALNMLLHGASAQSS